MDNERIVLRIPNDGSDRELVSALLEDSVGSLPFSLPPLVHWPKGSRACSDRALLLMRAGLLYLQQHSSKASQVQSPRVEQQQNAREESKTVSKINFPSSSSSEPKKQSSKAKKPEFDVSLFQ